MQEDALQYVIRKLNDPAFNRGQIVRQTSLSNTCLHNIAEEKTDPRYSNVLKIYHYFKGLEDKNA